MPYTALPDRRMPYDNDGSVLYCGNTYSTQTEVFNIGPVNVLTGANEIAINDDDMSSTNVPLGLRQGGSGSWAVGLWIFFPELREVTAYSLVSTYTGGGTSVVHGSADSTNGNDGTWETASLPDGTPSEVRTNDQWRANIKAISFTGGKRTIRIGSSSLANGEYTTTWHVYGEKVAGQTPDDLIFIDHDTTPGTEYSAPEDFGDQPLATTVVRQFRVKNASATKTANSINLQCNDSDFAISTDSSTWVATINITSLAAGAESATMYVRCVTPAVGAAIGPRFNRIIATVASYT